MNILTKQLFDILSEYDAKTLQSQIDTIQVRRDALKEIKREDFKHFSHPSIAIAYAKIKAVGGKSWYSLLLNSDQYIIDRLTKQEEAKVAKRNFKISEKLQKAGIKEIKEFQSTTSRDGFEGVWNVDTEQGPKKIILDVILAGGYNIQCLHARILVKVK